MTCQQKYSLGSVRRILCARGEKGFSFGRPKANDGLADRTSNRMVPTFHPGIAGAYSGSPCNASGRPYPATGHDFGPRRIFSDRHCRVSIDLQRSREALEDFRRPMNYDIGSLNRLLGQAKQAALTTSGAHQKLPAAVVRQPLGKPPPIAADRRRMAEQEPANKSLFLPALLPARVRALGRRGGSLIASSFPRPAGWAFPFGPRASCRSLCA